MFQPNFLKPTEGLLYSICLCLPSTGMYGVCTKAWLMYVFSLSGVASLSLRCCYKTLGTKKAYRSTRLIFFLMTPEGQGPSWCGRQGSRNTRWLSTLHMWSGSREMNSGTHHLLFLLPSWDPSLSDSATYTQGLPFSVKYIWEYTHRHNQRCLYLLECLTLPVDNED